jgi:hypothetical protein
LNGGLHGAAGRQQIIDDNHSLAGLDGIEMDRFFGLRTGTKPALRR